LDLGTLFTFIGTIGTCVLAVSSIVAGINWLLRRRSARRKAAIFSSAHKPSGEAEGPFHRVCDLLAVDVADWFKERFEKFEQFTKTDGLRSLDASLQKPVIEQIAHEVSGFPGGIYVINEAKVSAQHTPHAVEVPDIGGYEVTARPYYIDCKRYMKTITSNAFLSANRDKIILVVATPRFDHNDRFIGILDGVIDIVSAPFSGMAREALKNSGWQGPFDQLRAILIDKYDVLIGSSHGTVDGAASVGGNERVRALRAALGDSQSYSSADGAISCVEGTPYFAVCYRHAT
jgi:hypothetical protein